MSSFPTHGSHDSRAYSRTLVPQATTGFKYTMKIYYGLRNAKREDIDENRLILERKVSHSKHEYMTWGSSHSGLILIILILSISVLTQPLNQKSWGKLDPLCTSPEKSMMNSNPAGSLPGLKWLRDNRLTTEDVKDRAKWNSRCIPNMAGQAGRVVRHSVF